MIATGKRQSGEITRRVMSVEDYISSSGPYLEKEGFFETEIGSTKEQFGNIVHVFSAYETKKTATDEKPFMRGINSIQLWNDGKRWWIVTVFWEAERPDKEMLRMMDFLREMEMIKQARDLQKKMKKVPGAKIYTR